MACQTLMSTQNTFINIRGKHQSNHYIYKATLEQNIARNLSRNISNKYAWLHSHTQLNLHIIHSSFTAGTVNVMNQSTSNRAVFDTLETGLNLLRFLQSLMHMYAGYYAPLYY